MTFPLMVILLAIMIAVVAFIVYVERGERRIPVQYAKRVVGRRVMGGQSTHLPLACECWRRHAGNLRVFDFDLAANYRTMGMRNNRYFARSVPDRCGWGEPLYTLLYAVGIIFFAYFYVSIVFNPERSRRQHA